MDLRDLTATVEATAGASVLIHLAGIAEEAPFPEICEHNIHATYHVLEAARRHRIPRVVLASSHHTIGFTPHQPTGHHHLRDRPGQLLRGQQDHR